MPRKAITKPPRRVIVFAGLGLIIASLFLTTYPFSHEKNGIRDPRGQGRVSTTGADDSTDLEEGRPDRNKTQRETNNLQEQLLRADNATIAIVKSLEEDEARRASLISKKDSADQISFIFRIERNPDLEKLISEMCKKAAAEAKISPIALRNKVNDRVAQFFIPEGKIQKVFVDVPLDVTKMPSYLMIPCSPTGPPEDIKGSSGTSIGGKVKMEDGWRFEKLLELGKPD